MGIDTAQEQETLSGTAMDRLGPDQLRGSTGTAIGTAAGE